MPRIVVPLLLALSLLGAVSAKAQKNDVSPPERLRPFAAWPALPEARTLSIRRVTPRDKADKAVALTFDACELATNVSGFEKAAVEALVAQRAKATFFLGGKWMRSHPEAAKALIANPMFEIGNHNWTHGNMGVLPIPEAENQLLWTQAQFELLRAELVQELGESVLGHVPPTPRWFRPPYGRCRPETLDLTARHGLAQIQWDVVGEAYDGTDPGKAAERIAGVVKPGSIILMHVNAVPKDTGRMLPLLLDALQSKGFRFVTVSELLELGEPVRTRECFFTAPGDNLKYDRIFGDGTRRVPQ